MEVAGFIKNSFVDYPGNIAAVIFVPGCNMDCWYCHNRQLWTKENLLDLKEIDAFLEKHKGFIDGVVISGGEPTLQKDIKDYILRIKDMGYRVKLDTNGLKPDVVDTLMPDIDFIAMDIKAPPGAYSQVVSFAMDESPIWQCADLIMNGYVDYELRTTFMPLLSVEDIEQIVQRIQGAKKYALQQYRKTDFVGIKPGPHSASVLRVAADIAGKYVQKVIIRGI